MHGQNRLAHLNVPLKVEEVNSLPVAAIQGQNIPGLRARREKQTFRVKFPPPSIILHTQTEGTLKHTEKHIQSRTHAYTNLVNTLTRETWAQRQSVTTSRKEKILEDRQGRFRDPDPRYQKLPLYTRLCPQLSRASASNHSAGLRVNQLILSLTVNRIDVFTLFAG